MDYSGGHELVKPGGKPLFYQAKPVPVHLQDFIYACQQGDVDVVKALWRPHWLHELNKLKREDTCHPLLTAVHHLRPAVVEFLCDQGLSPFRVGTVHPYTGDGMVVTELQGISPMNLIDKMSFLHPRRSKRRVLIDEVKEVLMRAVANLGGSAQVTPKDDGDATPAATFEEEGDDDMEFRVPSALKGSASAAAMTPASRGGLKHRLSDLDDDSCEDDASEDASGADDEAEDDEGASEDGVDASAMGGRRGGAGSLSTPVTARRERLETPPHANLDVHAAQAALKKRKVVIVGRPELQRHEDAGTPVSAAVAPAAATTPAAMPVPVLPPVPMEMPKPRQLQYAPVPMPVAPAPLRASPARSAGTLGAGLVKTPPGSRGGSVPRGKPAATPVAEPSDDEGVSEDEGVRIARAKDSPPRPGIPTVAVAFLPGSADVLQTTVDLSLPSKGVPHLPPDVPVPAGAAVGTVTVPCGVSVAQVMLSVMRALCAKGAPCDFSDAVLSINALSAACDAPDVQCSGAEDPSGLRSPPRIPRLRDSWAGVLPLVPSILPSTAVPRRTLSVRHVHVSGSPLEGPAVINRVSELKGLDVESALKFTAAKDPDDDRSVPFQALLVSFDAVVPPPAAPDAPTAPFTPQRPSGFLLYLRGHVVAHRWAYQMASLGMLATSIPGPVYLTWERAAAMHVDDILAGRRRGAAVVPRVAPVPAYGAVRPAGKVVHVGRSPTVRFLSTFDERGDTDFESLAAVVNSARQKALTPSTPAPAPFDKLVLWLDARALQALKTKPLSSFLHRQLAAVIGSLSCRRGCDMLIVARCVISDRKAAASGTGTKGLSSAQPASPPRSHAVYTEALSTGNTVAAALHGQTFSTPTGDLFTVNLVPDGVHVVPYSTPTAAEYSFSCRLVLV